MAGEFSTVTSRTGSQPLSFKKINVLLGANGTGKSSFLAELRNRIKEALPGHNTVNIEGGRAIQMVDSLELTAQNFSHYRTFDQTIKSYKKKRAGTLQSRIFDALKSLEQTSENFKTVHSDAVTAWNERGRIDGEGNPCEVPLRKADPMTRVFEAFSDIFPSIKLLYRPENRRLVCIKKGNEYGPTSLSDGEKQVFSILVDIVELADKQSVLFVDEPELNLNPGLANRVWNSIETILPDAIFIYATHSVNFALRENVDLLLVLSNEDANIQRLSDLSDLTQKDRKELLGNIPGLIENKKTLVVEGEDESFDAVFYDWVLKDDEVSPTAVGGSEDVKAIVLRQGKWQKISPNVRLTGVVDRDYKPDAQLNKFSDLGVVALEVHEAESYICSPEILVQVADALRTVAAIPSEADIEQMIIEFCKRERIRTVARRVSEKLHYRVGVSIPSKTLAKVVTHDQLKSLILHDVENQKKNLENELDEQTVLRAIDKEIAKIDKAIGNREVIELLSLFPGKELMKELSRKVGCESGIAVARAARHHLSLDKFPSLVTLRTRLQVAIGSAAADAKAAS